MSDSTAELDSLLAEATDSVAAAERAKEILDDLQSGQEELPGS